MTIFSTTANSSTPEELSIAAKDQFMAELGATKLGDTSAVFTGVEKSTLGEDDKIAIKELSGDKKEISYANLKNGIESDIHPDANTLQNETPSELRDRSTHTGNAPAVNVSIDTNPLTDKTITNVQLLAQKVDANPADYIPQGEIDVAADFPTLGTVQAGWLYVITSNVTDNDVAKTNTGQSFLEGVSIVWATNGSWLDLGSNYVTQAQIDKLNLGANYIGTIDLSSAVIGSPSEGATVTPTEDGPYPNYSGLVRDKELCNFEYIGAAWIKKTIAPHTNIFNDIAGIPEAPVGFYHATTGDFTPAAGYLSKKFSIDTTKSYSVTTKTNGTLSAMAVYFNEFDVFISSQNVNLGGIEVFEKVNLIIPVNAEFVGVTNFDLVLYGTLGEIIDRNIFQSIGQSETDLMSQKAISDTFSGVAGVDFTLGKNLFNENDPGILPDEVISFSTGDILGLSGFSVSGFSEVKPLTSYIVSESLLDVANFVVRFNDKNKGYLSFHYNGTDFKFTTPADCYFVQMNISQANRLYFDTQLEAGIVATTREPYNRIIKKDEGKIYNLSNTNGFTNDRVAACGDSITWGAGSASGTYSWSDRLNLRLRFLSYVKLAVSGATISNFNAPSGHLAQQVALIPLDTTLIYFMMGVNDEILNTPRGDSATILAKPFGTLVDNLTSGESWRLNLETTKRAFPYAKIIAIMTTQQAGWTSAAGLNALIDIQIDICNYLSIPIINASTESGILCNEDYLISPFMFDNLHPNDAGHDRLDNFVATKSNSL